MITTGSEIVEIQKLFEVVSHVWWEDAVVERERNDVMTDSDGSAGSFFEEPVFRGSLNRDEEETQPLDFGDEHEVENDSSEGSPFVAQMPPTPPLQQHRTVDERHSPPLPTTSIKIAQFASKLGITSDVNPSTTGCPSTTDDDGQRPSTSTSHLKRSAKITISPTKIIKRRRFGSGEPVRTFVFMDFETTGMIGGNQDNQRCLLDRKLSDPEDYSNSLSKLILETQRSEYPRITEMSFISVPRETFTRAQVRMQELCNEMENGCIRVRVAANVHTRQLNPELDDRRWHNYESSRVAGKSCISLPREDLILKQTFAQEWPAVRNFLDSCPKPACIVAHNGLCFDYRVLYGELSRCGFIEQDMGIPEGVVFIDSYLTIRELEDMHRNELHHVTKLVDWKLLSENICPTHVPAFEEEAGAAREVENRPVSVVQQEFEEMNFPLHLAPQRLDEPHSPIRPPPVRGTRSESPKVSCRRRLFDAEPPVNDHPLLFLNAEEWSPAKRRRVRPEFFKRTTGGRWDFNRSVAQMSTRNKLTTIYEAVLKGEYDAHFAQDDADALLQVCLAYGSEFLDYADNKAADFPF
ncbi:hypothetical protein KIN20_035877 [Parelaphostrongylus tenuis]|uniref:Exonuclease domain-containing protein n=1 Tax=Parelaphostrongylus tenuis TaxID=148309 RepID=A0AAD5RBV5_PARTN|nr:hypothetical protein KIN20_035877 [Parelaphostrongylus tenuis]